MIKLLIKHWTLEIALELLTRNITPKVNVTQLHNGHLNDKWSIVLESNIGGYLVPHVESIVAHCLEDQNQFNNGHKPPYGNVYERVQQYALPFIRRQFGLISPTAVEKLSEYNHDDHRTRTRRSITYPHIPNETASDRELRKKTIARAEEMDKLGYSMDEIQKYIKSNRSENAKLTDYILEDIEDQLVHQLDNSIINGTFVAGMLIEANVISRTHFTVYFG